MSVNVCRSLSDELTISKTIGKVIIRLVTMRTGLRRDRQLITYCTIEATLDGNRRHSTSHPMTRSKCLASDVFELFRIEYD